MNTAQLIITLALGALAIFVAGWLGLRSGGAQISFREYLSPLWRWKQK